MTRRASPMGLVAGAGMLPIELASRWRRDGLEPQVACIRGAQDERSFSGMSCATFPIGQVGAVQWYFRSRGVERAVLLGGVSRDRLFGGSIDWSGAKLLLESWRGDDALLRAVADSFLEAGVEIVSPLPWLADWLAPQGPVAGPPMTAPMRTELVRAFQAAIARAPGATGQSLGWYAGKVVAMEDRAGTDAMVARLPGPGALLVKVPRAGQDPRLDIPVIGPSTVRIAAARGVAAIGVSAGQVLIAQRDLTERLCERTGVALVGLSTTVS